MSAALDRSRGTLNAIDLADRGVNDTDNVLIIDDDDAAATDSDSAEPLLEDDVLRPDKKNKMTQDDRKAIISNIMELDPDFNAGKFNALAPPDRVRFAEGKSLGVGREVSFHRAMYIKWMTGLHAGFFNVSRSFDNSRNTEGLNKVWESYKSSRWHCFADVSPACYGYNTVVRELKKIHSKYSFFRLLFIYP
jgi:hypothetical protein